MVAVVGVAVDDDFKWRKEVEGNGVEDCVRDQRQESWGSYCVCLLNQTLPYIRTIASQVDTDLIRLGATVTAATVDYGRTPHRITESQVTDVGLI